MNLDLTFILTLFLVSIRIGAMTYMIPLFSVRFMPGQISIIFILLVAAMITPPLMPFLPAVNSVWGILFLAIGECLVGLLLGIAVRSFFAITELAGHMISTEIGLMMAQQFDPESGAQSQLVTVLLFYLGGLLFLMTGAHHLVFNGLVRSYGAVGFAKESLVIGSVSSVVSVLSEVFVVSVSIAAPFIAVNFLVTLSFGVLGKVAPRINVMIISFSFRILGGLVVLLITANLIFNFLMQYAEETPRTMLQILH